MKDNKNGFKLQSFEELMGFKNTEPEVKVSEKDEETEVELSKLLPFKNHPFRVDCDSEDFQQLVESVKDTGVIYPILIRPLIGKYMAISGKCKGRRYSLAKMDAIPEVKSAKKTRAAQDKVYLRTLKDKYEILAGHRRVEAYRQAGQNKINAIIRLMDDYDATVVMVHSNFYREEIRISEKAKAYRMCMDAEKHQGKKGGDTAALIGKNQDSKRQVYRYIRLSYLIDDFLNMLDMKKIPISTGLELAYLDKNSQSLLINFIDEYGIIPSTEQAASLRKKYEMKEELLYEQIIVELTSNMKKKVLNSVSFKKKDLQGYFDEDADAEYMSNVIIMLLEKYKAGAFDELMD